jgi:alpha/beta superfamily hydrolase
MVEREDVSFPSDGDEVAAWFLRGAGTGTSDDTGPAPCVVMAHGFSLTRHDGLLAYAEAIAATGVHVLVFDHRHLGDSGGTPRQLFRLRRQQADWRAAVAWARSRPEVDGDRIVLWGYSFSGGHVASLLASGLDAYAALVLCPFADGLKRVLATPLRLVAWVVPRALLDVLGRHLTIPVTGPPGSRAAMPFPGEADGFAAALGRGSPWVNAITPGVFLTVGMFRPVARARRITPPLWVGRCADDITVDAGAVARLAERAPQGELHDFPGDHFAPFSGEVTASVRDSQLEFLERVLRPRP